MRKSAPFAASFLSAFVAVSALAADLRPVKDPAKIDSVFSRTAKLRFVNLWATWCVPCVAETPELRAIDEAFGEELAMVGVSMDDMIPGAKPAAVATFLDKHKIGFPNVYYTGNPDALGDHFKFDGEIPVTIVYDQNGKELWRWRGRLHRLTTIAHLRRLLRRMQ